MLVSDKDALERLQSSENLMNRLSLHRSNTNSNNNNHKKGMSLFIPGKGETLEPKTSFNPFQKETTALVPTPSSPPEKVPPEETSDKTKASPSLDDLVGNADTQVKLGLAHDIALNTLVDSVKLLQIKLDDIKPEKLTNVITATSKVVDQIQRQRIEANKKGSQQEVHYHFYTPTQKTIEDYTVIDVG